jgi:integrase
MNALRKALADYFAVRRALGFKLYRAEKLLNQFLTFVEDRGEDHIKTETALAWATLPQRGRTWAYARLSVVRRFANYMRGIDPATEVPATHLLVQQKGRATPYLYSESDIAALITAAGMLRTPHRVATFRTLIALLAVTGMRVGEAIGLDRDDFDAINGLLTIRNAKFGKSRELPLHPSTVIALVKYLHRSDRPINSLNTPAFLVTTVGTRFHYMGVQPVFRQIVGGAGLGPRSASCRPRLHDLRHGFAVNTILDGYRDGGEPGNRIALLSTYLGHVDPVSTYWYLSAAPELLALAGGRLERHLGGAA